MDLKVLCLLVCFMVPCDYEEAISQIYLGQAGEGNRAAICAFLSWPCTKYMWYNAQKKFSKYCRTQAVTEDPSLLD